MSAVWLQPGTDAATLTLHVQPGARRSEIAGTHGDALKIRLAAPAVDGRANACLIEFLARRLGVAKSNVELVAGAAGRRKRVRIRGAAPQALASLGER